MTTNPFSLTKANDLSDEQINSFWVDVGDAGAPTSLFGAGRFASAMPTMILGGKGSGKTHLMRYASFPLQKLRFSASKTPIVDGVVGDGYIGIYVRCSGLDSGRFQGKGQPSDAWLEVFSYYLELWLGQCLLRITQDLCQAIPNPAVEASICDDVQQLFGHNPPIAQNLNELEREFDRRRKALDFEVDNAAFTGTLSPSIALSRGRMIFGLPRVVATNIPALQNVLFTYELDEFENLYKEQQQHINTLIREREPPATFKIGARQFGVKSFRTLSADEENIRDSEFDEIRLDERLRQSDDQYKTLVERLVQRRLDAFISGRGVSVSESFGEWFDDPSPLWNAEYFLSVVRQRQPVERPHMRELQAKLSEGIERKAVSGVQSNADIDEIVCSMSVDEAPLLEKLNLLTLYHSWARGRNVRNEAHRIERECSAFRKGERVGPYFEKLGRFKGDLIAQLLRENGYRQTYAGLDTFIRISEGQPRALITLLKHTYDWAVFQGEKPFVTGKVSIEAQSKGATAAAEWFYNSMMKAGEDGADILTAIDRLAELFRINRFANNIRECSLIAFSAPIGSLRGRSTNVIRLAKDRSFLVEVQGGQLERNSESVTTKLQLNRMLVPRWRLATGRRGVIPLRPQDLEAIFDPSKVKEFGLLSREWAARGEAPLFGGKGSNPPNDDDPEDQTIAQSDLFNN